MPMRPAGTNRRPTSCSSKPSLVRSSKILACNRLTLFKNPCRLTGDMKGLDLVEILKRVARLGFVVGITGRSATGSNVVAVLRGGNDPVFRRLIDDLASRVAKEGAGQDQKAAPAPAARAARRPRPLTKDIVWWLENGDLVLAGKSIVDEIMAVVDGKEQSAVDHPFRVELKKPERGFQPAGIGFVDMAALAPLGRRGQPARFGRRPADRAALGVQ